MKYGKEKGKRVDIFIFDQEYAGGVFLIASSSVWVGIKLGQRAAWAYVGAEKGDANACVQNQGLNATPSVPDCRFCFPRNNFN